MLPPRSNKLIVHLDMNSYFASVEQQANPALRGKPVGVCAYLHKYGCVIAASIEAKRLGIRVGMSMIEARAVCPSAVFVQNDPPKYRAVTSRVFSLLHQMTDCVEHYSIDEAFLDFTDWYRDAAEVAWVMSRMRQRIKDEVGEWLKCSIGIAPTRFLAKTASDFEKPEGLTVITHENLDAILGELDLEDVCGIGPRIRRRLECAGISDLLKLKNHPVANLMQMFGKYGFFLWCKLHGREFERVEAHEDAPAPKSIGHSYCVPDLVNREGKVLSVLTRLTERAGRRMRREGFLAGAVSVVVGFRSPLVSSPEKAIGFSTPPARSASEFTHLDEPASDSFTLVEAACTLLGELWSPSTSSGLMPRVNFLAVTLSDFSEPNSQQSFSAGGLHAPLRVRQRLSTAVDFVRDRYGDDAIMLGAMFGVGDHAPDRIGFRKTEGVEVLGEN